MVMLQPFGRNATNPNTCEEEQVDIDSMDTGGQYARFTFFLMALSRETTRNTTSDKVIDLPLLFRMACSSLAVSEFRGSTFISKFQGIYVARLHEMISAKTVLYYSTSI